MGFVRRHRLLSSLLLASLAALTVPASAGAATVFVDDDSPNPLPACGVSAALACQTIQFGVNAANPLGGDVIQVAAGTYDEQVTVNKPVTINGAGQSATTILSPASLTPPMTLGTNRPVVYVNAGPTTIQNLTVDGGGVGNANAGLVGIAYHNAAGTVSGTLITNVRDTPIGMDPDGFGLFGLNDDAMPRTLNVSGNTVNQFQKAGMVFQGAGLTASVGLNTVTGVGPTTTVAQNGIQVLGGAGGAISTNLISALDFTPTTACGEGISFFAAASGASATSNLVSGVECGIGASMGATTTFSSNIVSGSRIGISRFDGPGTIANNLVTGGPQPDSLGLSVAESNLDADFSVTTTGNSLTGHNDQAIRLEDFDADAFQASLVANFNRIAGNPGGGAVNSGDSFNAENNWWGCNEGPGTADCETVAGTIDTDPHLTLRVAANPTTVVSGAASTITADLAQNSSGAIPSGNSFPSGTPIGFAATLGSISSSVPTSGPSAFNSFIAGPTPGSATITATLDSESVSTPVTVAAQSPATGTQGPGRCENQRTGNAQANVFTGTADGDRLKGRGGNDTLRGRAGDDCLNGGAGKDKVVGGIGDDHLKGGRGDDDLIARDGEADRVRCGGGEDRAVVDRIDNTSKCEDVI
jgi:hypothetical protein